MKKPPIKFLFIFLFLFQIILLYGQQKIFNHIQIPGLDAASTIGITAIAQDHQGNIWLLAKNKGLYKYDGSQAISYVHDPKDSNSIAGASLETIMIDADDNIWIGTLGGGMDKFDPAKNKFIHFKHHANDPGSLAHDTVTAILQDHSGNLWIGTYRGLDLYDRKKEKFIHYQNKTNDANSLSANYVRVIYEDKQRTLWIGCGSTSPNEESWPDEGGLNRFNRATGKFTRFLHDPENPNSLANNKVRSILEDSKENFWIGTGGDGLHTLDRNTGKFTHYYYDSAHPQNLSRPPVHKEFTEDLVAFIKEDVKGKLWIGSLKEGINAYDPQTKKLTHHGLIQTSDKILVADTLTGFTDDLAWSAFSARDGLLWITTLNGNVFNFNPFDKPVIPYTDLPKFNINNIYKDDNDILWIGTVQGLIRKDANTGKEKIFLHEPGNINSLSNNIVNMIVADDNNILWLATIGGGLDKFDAAANKFTHYKKDDSNPKSIISDTVIFLFMDQSKNLWITTAGGLDKMNIKTGEVLHLRHDDKNDNSLSSNIVIITDEDKSNIWGISQNSVNQINKSTGKIKHYLVNTFTSGVCVDAAGVVWAGTAEGLYKYNKTTDEFLLFNDTIANTGRVINIIEDNKRNLWITTQYAIFKIDEKREIAKVYGPENGVHQDIYFASANYKTKKGELLLVGSSGYYDFFPENIADDSYPPQINITGLQIGGREILPGAESILSKPIYNSEEITLPQNKNSFSISFSAIHFRTPGEERYLYMLENYDNKWHESGADRKAYFYSLNPGHYILRVKAINPDGVWREKKLSIIITPPWWQTWWAITLAALSFIAIVWGFFYYRSQRLRTENRLLETKVAQRTAQLEQSLDNLKATKAQLIQSEKMASLGELTAGIAHEIQNPLNFVNNFSEVNTELIDEMKNELMADNKQEAISIADDIKINEEKINHHGKRADAIVKGMLQHSRTSTGQKELTDINALVDEYLRLSYHGLRAKDKSFNATMETHFDPDLGKINIVQQDVGRVILNLFTNAFYSVTEKKKTSNPLKGEQGYEPTVFVSTKKIKTSKGWSVEIRVKDNGMGIQQKVLDKIYQPFFTTKPAGQGTGLGLSLSYDIIKAYGGELKVETKEGEFAEFIIQLPA